MVDASVFGVALLLCGLCGQICISTVISRGEYRSNQETHVVLQFWESLDA